MKVSLNLLRRLVHLPEGADAREIALRMTMAGVEIESLTEVARGLSGAIVAEVRGKRRHPKADKLTLVDVFDGEKVTQVVCGAPNVPEPGEPGRGPRVVWARPGATLPGGLTLGEKEVRGVLSPGMLAAEDELGLSEDHAGILVLGPEDHLPIGADFAGGVGLPDTVLELNVTPNRPDALGHVGVARELCALFHEEGARMEPHPRGLFGSFGHRAAAACTATSPEFGGVELRDAQGCPRYTARVLPGVRVGRSPIALRLLLQRLGMRAVSNVVDATNLAMLLWGQPLHAFDLDRLAGHRIVVRRALPGERLKTLDGGERALDVEDVVIADAAGPVALAGVMGGAHSEVTAATTTLLLESAYFDPQRVRRSARRLRMHTEASHRFERGVDPGEGVLRASESCAELIHAICGGGSGEGAFVDCYPAQRPPLVLTLRPARTEQLLGAALPAAQQQRLLTALGLTVRPGPAGTLQVTVPTARPDLTREADLIEEVARLWGYQHVPPRLPALRALEAVGAPASQVADRARDLCVALGFDEIQTFSFVAPERLAHLGLPVEPLRLHNPLREELSVLRTQVLVGLLEAARHNHSHGLTDVRLFEVGEAYLPAAAEAGEPQEHGRVAGVLYGSRERWLKAAEPLDFFDLRGVVDELLAGLGVRGATLRAAAAGEVPWLHPGVAAVLVGADGATLGELGEVHPELLRRLGMEEGLRLLAFELALPRALPATPRFTALPRYPAVSRDLSFFIEEGVPAGAVLAALYGSGEALLTQVQVLEDYREAGRVPAGKKGLLLSLTYRSPERTLTDEEVAAAHEQVLARLRAQHAIELR